MAKKHKKTQVAKSTYSRQQKMKEALLNEQIKKMPLIPDAEPQELQESLEPQKPQESLELPEAAENIPNMTEMVQASEGGDLPDVPAVPDIKHRALLETLWFGLDYGSILTAFSLAKVIERLGWEAVLMNKPPMLWTEHYDDPNNIAGKFIYKYCQVEPVARRAKELNDMVQRSDAVVVGSDIVWNYDVCTRQTHYHYYLDFVADDKKKISYGSSFGFHFSGPFGEETTTISIFCGNVLAC